MRRNHALNLALLLGFVWLTMLVSACGTEPATEVPTATATAPAADAAVETEATGATTELEAAGELLKGGDASAAIEAVTAVAERTPVPTTTPGPVEEQVDDLARATGLAGKSFLGLTAEDWINVGISFLIALLGYLIGAAIGVKLLVRLLKQIVRRTSTGLDDAFLDAIETQLKWLVMLLVVRFALLRLDFWGDVLRILIDDVCFALGLGIIMAIALKLINVAAGWYRDEAEPEKDKARLDPMVLILQRSGQVLVLVVGVSIGLSHFGINVTALSAALVLVALVISLGAKDIISDAISGFIILMDQPFRVGDVIAIEELNKWGDVVDIGTRSTRMRTRDNRFVIVPNSKIAASQVINYTFPDPEFRVYTNIRIAYGSDFDQVRRVAEAAVRGVAGVLPDRPVDVLFHEYGDSARTMRVRWWIEDMHQEYYIIDRVNVALERALGEAGIDIAFTRYDLNVKLEGEKAGAE